MDVKRVDTLIRWHQDWLTNVAFVMSPSSIVLTQETIKALEELKQLKAGNDGKTG